MPMTSQDFQRAAGQRLTAARVLSRDGMTLDAQYLADYTIECSLKALILHHTPVTELAVTLTKITAGASMHKPLVLADKLRQLGVDLHEEVADLLGFVDGVWSTNLRYESGLRDVEETERVLATAKVVYNWAEGDLP